VAIIDMSQKKGGGCCAPFAGGAGFPSNTMWPGPRSTSLPSGVFIHPAIWPQQTWAENWGAVPRLGGVGSPSNTVTWAEAYLHTNWHLSPSSRLATTDMGQKLRGDCAALGEGELGPHLTQCRLG